MKTTQRVVPAVCAILLLAFSVAIAAELELFGKIALSGGAEKEQGGTGGPRGTIEALGVVPLWGNLGVQGLAHYVGGSGSRYGISAGPVFAWGGGKAGLFVNYQHRTFNSNNFVHVIPALALYFDQMNLNLWYAHPVSSPQRDGGKTEYGQNKLQATVSYFAGSDWASFLKKDNVELIFGVQANTFAGAGRSQLQSAAVGPVVGLAFMPTKDVAVNVFHMTIDNRSAYRATSGLEFFFGGNNATLKQTRRKYLEPNQDIPPAAGQVEEPTRSSLNRTS
jgi:hypothetical protein